MLKNYFPSQLDEYQKNAIIYDNNMLIIAGAGSGKTFTLINKINYLIEEQKISPQDILVVSFTNASVNDISLKASYSIDIVTFHKLAIKILTQANVSFGLANDHFLSYIINESLHTCNAKDQKYILKFLKFSGPYKKFVHSNEFASFKKFIITFINLWKANDFNYSNIPLEKVTKLERHILIIIFNIFLNYIKEKNSQNKLDFDDLIKAAAEKVKEIKLNYKYIIIDEFQDTSLIRLKLIKEIYKHTNSHIIVVGDDYQSIYRFSGCNLNIFLNFSSFFPSVKTIVLKNIYRNSQELSNIATKFIQKNPLQINKKLISAKHTKYPIIFAPYTNKIEHLKKVLNHLINYTDDIMILSRNNNDIYEYIDEEFKIEQSIISYHNIKIKYFTVHKSKGLEANSVIVLNCNNNIVGFPNKIENNSLINKVFPFKEMKHAEERRLFYVAITRAKENTFLLYDKHNCSTFIKEIRKIAIKELSKITYFK